MNKLKQNEPGAYSNIFGAFENVKRTIDTTTTGNVNVTFPFASFDSLCQKHLSESFDSALASSKYKGDIIRRGDKIRFEIDLMKSLFGPTIHGIISLVKSVLEKREARMTSLIIMVGGFYECHLIQAELRKQFPKHRIIVPEQADLAVLKGAVLFGQNLSVIESRLIKTTYGVAMTA
ncbi:heat shock 70 kDa protein 12A-like [Mytilus edulis]|uniref:heat shock 70 kDa protein 12A-like n=1 Tax=Mytilus edulis TaxID=6550 RepID=UPI0039F03ACD